MPNVYQPESFYETTLASAITAAQTTIPVTTAPNITSGYMVIEANTSNREIILYTGVTGTTLTGVSRGLAEYGSDNSAGTGKAHAAGVDLAGRDVHYYYAQYYDFLTGTSATGANSMAIGDGNTISASNRLWEVNTSSLSAFWGLSSNGRMVVSEDGITSYVISAGGSGVTAGDGIDITAGVLSVDYENSLAISPGSQLGVATSSLIVNDDSGGIKVDTTSAMGWSGQQDFAVADITTLSASDIVLIDTNLETLVDGSNADSLHLHTSIATDSLSAVERSDDESATTLTRTVSGLGFQPSLVKLFVNTNNTTGSTTARGTLFYDGTNRWGVGYSNIADGGALITTNFLNSHTYYKNACAAFVSGEIGISSITADGFVVSASFNGDFGGGGGRTSRFQDLYWIAYK